jgi:hypothetical protein
VSVTAPQRICLTLFCKQGAPSNPFRVSCVRHFAWMGHERIRETAGANKVPDGRTEVYLCCHPVLSSSAIPMQSPKGSNLKLFLPAVFLFPRLKPQRPPPPENAGTRFRPLPRLLYVESRQVDSSSLPSRRSFVSPRSMCHPGLPPLPPGCTVIRRRDRQAGVVASPPAAALARPTPARHVLAQPHYHCVCSPTAHRGSFRCRWHRSSYECGRRQPCTATQVHAEATPTHRDGGIGQPSSSCKVCVCVVLILGSP